ncbi:MAG: hypothetical protein II559_02150, partial [Muribaculaceae bacterium]|nr:hypothetical protein [Muribaculaceae bacterium]
DGYILVIKLINDSWRFINCYMLFDKPIKNLSREDILKHVIGPNYFDYNENKNLNYSVIKYCERLIKSGLIDYYQNYYSEIHNIVRNRGIEYGFNVNTDFVILQSDAITEFSKKKLSLIWQYLVDHKHIDSGDNNDAVKKSFIDFWSNSIFCNTVKIKWISTAKNKGTNFSLLYVFGEIMGLDMAKIQSKQRLCSCFIDKTGIEIDPKQIKRRNESASQKKFKSDLLKIKNSS